MGAMRYLVKYEEQPAEGVHLFGLFFAEEEEIKALRALKQVYLGEYVYGLRGEALANVTPKTLQVLGPVAEIAQAEGFVGGIDLATIARANHPIPGKLPAATRAVLEALGWETEGWVDDQ